MIGKRYAPPQSDDAQGEPELQFPTRRELTLVVIAGCLFIDVVNGNNPVFGVCLLVFAAMMAIFHRLRVPKEERDQ
jgi:hypothetical protein